MIIENYKINITETAIVTAKPIKYGRYSSCGKYFKIYIVKYKNDFLHVGKAKQNIRTRFSCSFRTVTKKKENGVSEYGVYSGSRWIEDFQKYKKELDLFVFRIVDKFTDNDKLFIEAIEAEIVFLIGKETQRWPLKQHEIHFHNIEGTIEITQIIYQSVK